MRGWGESEGVYDDVDKGNGYGWDVGERVRVRIGMGVQ